MEAARLRAFINQGGGQVRLTSGEEMAGDDGPRLSPAAPKRPREEGDAKTTQGGKEGDNNKRKGERQ